MFLLTVEIAELIVVVVAVIIVVKMMIRPLTSKTSSSSSRCMSTLRNKLKLMSISQSMASGGKSFATELGLDDALLIHPTVPSSSSSHTPSSSSSSHTPSSSSPSPPSPWSVVYSSKISPNICQFRSNGDERASMTCGAALAILDDISTYSFFLNDQSSRPGVSVHLATELCEPCYAGQEVHIRVRTDKIGRTLGFCSMDIVDAKDSSKLYAKGSHIKFLDMGKVWDLLFGKRFFNFTMALIHAFQLDDPKSLTSSYINKLLGIKKNKVNESSTRIDTKIGSLFDNMNITNDITGTYKLIPRGGLNNPMGGLHGGALACFIDYSASKHANLHNTYIKKIETKYLSKSKGPILIKDIVMTPSTYESSGNVINEKDSTSIVQFNCYFEHH